MSEDRFKQLEARIRALEDINAGVARAFIAEPQKPQAKSTEQKLQKTEEQQHETTAIIDTILSYFPPELREYLTIGEGWIKTKYVSAELWNEMNAVAKILGYHYVKEYKNSRWVK